MVDRILFMVATQVVMGQMALCRRVIEVAVVALVLVGTEKVKRPQKMVMAV
jgi:uncharacterized membrane protein